MRELLAVFVSLADAFEITEKCVDEEIVNVKK